MEEKKALPKEQEEQEEQVDLSSDDSRREFMTKVMGAAGAIAAAGLLGGAASKSASAETVKMKRMAPVATTAPVAATAGMQPVGAVALKSQTLKNGFALQMSGANIGEVLQRENLLPRGASPDKVAVKLELST